MDGADTLITEQPDPEKPWGIGCVACSRYLSWLTTKSETAGEAAPPRGSAWATFAVGSGDAKTLGVEDLLRHVGRATAKSRDGFHAKAMDHFKTTRAADPDTEPLVRPSIGQDERDDVPTLTHMRICYDVVKRVTPPLGKTYEVECTRAREAGDAAATARRGGKHTAVKIARSVAEALFEQDRRLLSQGKIAAIGIAQDARKGLELTKVRFVTTSFDVHTRMIGLLSTPHKRAVEK